MFPSKWVICMFQPLIFQGVSDRKTIWTTIFGFYTSKKIQLLWVVDLSLKLTSLGWENLVCRNLRCGSSSGVQWLQYLFCKDAFTVKYNPEDFSRSEIYQEILLANDYLKKRFLHQAPAILWVSSLRCPSKIIVDWLLWWNKGIEEENAETYVYLLTVVYGYIVGCDYCMQFIFCTIIYHHYTRVLSIYNTKI